MPEEKNRIDIENKDISESTIINNIYQYGKEHSISLVAIVAIVSMTGIIVYALATLSKTGDTNKNQPSTNQTTALQNTASANSDQTNKQANTNQPATNLNNNNRPNENREIVEQPKNKTVAPEITSAPKKSVPSVKKYRNSKTSSNNNSNKDNSNYNLKPCDFTAEGCGKTGKSN